MKKIFVFAALVAMVGAGALALHKRQKFVLPLAEMRTLHDAPGDDAWAPEIKVPHPNNPTPKIVDPAAARVNVEPFSFAVSGDSRDCGDLVMPAIAKGVQGEGAKFYWHLGDFRRMWSVDIDMQDRIAMRGEPMPTSAQYYNSLAWPDFIDNQLAKFSLPVYLNPGNHEYTYPMKHYPDPAPQDGVQMKSYPGDYVSQFGKYRPGNADSQSTPYYAWTESNGAVQFVSMDNANGDTIDDAQLAWFDGILDRDEKNGGVATIVVAMHEALPGSAGGKHNMNKEKNKNGEHVYARLLEAQRAYGKFVYALASHSHLYMKGIFKSKGNDAIPGWILGTAGAARVTITSRDAVGLDPGAAEDTQFKVYGYEVGQVRSDGSIDFEFKPLSKSDLQSAAGDHSFSNTLIDTCFDKNME